MKEQDFISIIWKHNQDLTFGEVRRAAHAAMCKAEDTIRAIRIMKTRENTEQPSWRLTKRLEP